MTLLATVALAACDDNPVEVSFAQPFPAERADAAAFTTQNQGQYKLASDTTRTLLVRGQQLIERRFATARLATRQLDSLGLLPRTGWQVLAGQPYQVQPLAADSFHLRWQNLDTLFSLGAGSPAHLRRFRTWYYLSVPTDSGMWHIERIAFIGNRLLWQEFNRDSLRIKALSAGSVSLTRRLNQLLFTLHPTSAREARQVHAYQGLWLTKGEYLRH